MHNMHSTRVGYELAVCILASIILRTLALSLIKTNWVESTDKPQLFYLAWIIDFYVAPGFLSPTPAQSSAVPEKDTTQPI